MSFPEGVAARALVASGRCCCICHKFCGTKIELHHIKQHAYGGEDTFENCIPLCFDCHEDMGKADPKHPKGKCNKFWASFSSVVAEHIKSRKDFHLW